MESQVRNCDRYFGIEVSIIGNFEKLYLLKVAVCGNDGICRMLSTQPELGRLDGNTFWDCMNHRLSINWSDPVKSHLFN